MDAVVRDVGTRCWAWLDAHRDAFAPLHEDDPLHAKRLLAFGELAGILGNVRRRGIGGTVIDRLTAFVLEQIVRVDWETPTLRSPAFAVAPLVASRLYAACGRDASWLRAIAARQVALGALESIELLPYRRFELEHLLAATGVRASSRRALARRFAEALAPLAKPPSAYTTNDRYAVTHLVFALCDDGLRPAEAVVARRSLTRLRWLVAVGGRIAIVEREPDLLAESVSCVRQLGLDEPWFVGAAFALARELQDDEGGIPTFVQPPAVLADATFFQRYHATLMWAHAAT